MDTHDPSMPDPYDTTTVAEYYAALRALHAWADYGWRSASWHEALPPSLPPLPDDFAVKQLPRWAIVNAYIQACLRAAGTAEDVIALQAQRWLGALRVVAVTVRHAPIPSVPHPETAVSVVIRLPGRQLELAPQQEATFGRGRADLEIADPAMPWLAGRIHAADDYWTISNLSSQATYTVENAERAGEALYVPPGRLKVPVPFEIARLTVPGSDYPLSMTVFAPERTYAGNAKYYRTLTSKIPFALNENSRYFLVLVALCEPRLRDEASATMPTAAQIVERLRYLESCRDLTRFAVDLNLDYLAGTKLHVGNAGAETDEHERKVYRQCAAIVATALRFHVVSVEHLSLLPPRGWRSALVDQANVLHPHTTKKGSPRHRRP